MGKRPAGLWRAFLCFGRNILLVCSPIIVKFVAIFKGDIVKFVAIFKRTIVKFVAFLYICIVKFVANLLLTDRF